MRLKPNICCFLSVFTQPPRSRLDPYGCSRPLPLKPQGLARRLLRLVAHLAKCEIRAVQVAGLAFIGAGRRALTKEVGGSGEGSARKGGRAVQRGVKSVDAVVELA
jgi:hypothetical protein